MGNSNKKKSWMDKAASRFKDELERLRKSKSAFANVEAAKANVRAKKKGKK